jgi:pantothenate kinase
VGNGSLKGKSFGLKSILAPRRKALQKAEMTKMIDLADLTERLLRNIGTRQLVAVAGPPGSGKSTVAEKLETALNEKATGTAAILPMDGFHYDDMLLDTLGRKQRKGAPDTFDVAGFRHILKRLRDNTEAEIAVPVFDRDIEISRGGARLIPQNIPIIIVEGNYLLLKHAPWSMMHPLFTTTVMVATDENTLRDRLSARWRGYDFSEDEIRRRVESNDLPNGRFVMAESVPADFSLQ